MNNSIEKANRISRLAFLSRTFSACLGTEPAYWGVLTLRMIREINPSGLNKLLEESLEIINTQLKELTNDDD